MRSIPGRKEHPFRRLSPGSSSGSCCHHRGCLPVRLSPSTSCGRKSFAMISAAAHSISPFPSSSLTVRRIVLLYRRWPAPGSRAFARHRTVCEYQGRRAYRALFVAEKIPRRSGQHGEAARASTLTTDYQELIPVVLYAPGVEARVRQKQEQAGDQPCSSQRCPARPPEHCRGQERREEHDERKLKVVPELSDVWIPGHVFVVDRIDDAPTQPDKPAPQNSVRNQQTEARNFHFWVLLGQ